LSTTVQYSPHPCACPELETEIQLTGSTASPAQPAIFDERVRGRTILQPAGSFVLGLAEDGLPLELDPYNPATGPLLIAGDGGSGKTALLKSLAMASDTQDPGDILFGVITPFPEEWKRQEILPNCLGIWPAFHPATKDFLLKMINWANALQRSRQLVLLLVDGLDLLTSGGFSIQHELRHLLMIGPERHVFPVVTINPGHLAHLETWLGFFKTCLLGQMKCPQNVRLLFRDPKIYLAEQEAEQQFCLPRHEGWLKFRLQSIE